VERFKAIEIVPQPWPYSSTTIQQISKRETTPTGKVLYVVQFKDGQSAKVSFVFNQQNKEEGVFEHILTIFQ
jgi:hypothetical protein